MTEKCDTPNLGGLGQNCCVDDRHPFHWCEDGLQCKASDQGYFCEKIPNYCATEADCQTDQYPGRSCLLQRCVCSLRGYLCDAESVCTDIQYPWPASFSPEPPADWLRQGNFTGPCTSQESKSWYKNTCTGGQLGAMLTDSPPTQKCYEASDWTAQGQVLPSFLAKACLAS